MCTAIIYIMHATYHVVNTHDMHVCTFEQLPYYISLRKGSYLWCICNTWYTCTSHVNYNLDVLSLSYTEYHKYFVDLHLISWLTNVWGTTCPVIAICMETGNSICESTTREGGLCMEPWSSSELRSALDHSKLGEGLQGQLYYMP